jgi:8-oxo-dGTP pyrophosphatase MutT (NUDIX family)
MPEHEDSYVGQLRKLVGKRKLIVPATRAIIQNQQGDVLLILRRDNGQWGLPAGTIELGESVLDCLKREVKEETGLDVISATPIAVYSEPRFTFANVFGQEYQLFAVVFRVDEWSGSLVKHTDETVDARFFALKNLPEMPYFYGETLADFQAYAGQLILK